MRFLSDVFTTPGIGGVVVIATIAVLLVAYGLTLRWIANGAKRDLARSPRLKPHFTRAPKGTEAGSMALDDAESEAAYGDPDRTQAA